MIHYTRSEDLTATVIDVEAKIKNLTELRDRLRNMLASRPGVLKDVIEVERELFRVQSNLDSLQMNRKALAHRTEKVAVDITFQARKSITESGTFAPVVSAWNESIYVLVQSFALVITFIVAILPWLAVFGPILWVTVRLIKRIQAQRRKNLQDLIHPEEPQ